MCGICGYVDFQGNADKNHLFPMIKALQKRGPDDTGYFSDDRVCLAHSRLSIIDLQSGHQPIKNEAGDIIIIQNGEFYNFIECRNRLIASGHRFQTRSDTEVLIHMYEEKGLEAVEHVNGMFAFALYDKRKSMLILGRDRMGQKPLYYTLTPQGLAFASEMKSLMRYPFFTKNLNKRSLLKYFFYDYLPGKETMFSSCFKLSSGSLLVVNIKNRSIEERPFWDIPLFEKEMPLNFEAKKLRLFSHMQHSVKKRLRSDVPIGIFLSGGIDSSIISYLMKKESGQDSFHSFSVGYNEESYDESFYSYLMSNCVKTDHHHFILSDVKALETLQKIKTYLDEPFADSSFVPTYFLSENASRYVKVVLAGDGGDELFAGYQGFPVLKILAYCQHCKPLLKMFVNGLLPFLKSGNSYKSFHYLSKKFLQSFLFQNSITQVMSLFGSFSLAELSLLTGHKTEDIESVILEDINHYMDIRRTETDIHILQYLLAKLYLRDGVLVKIDRASMANSLEVRSPYLDHDLVEFAFSLIPSTDKLRYFQVKYILKETFKNVIPPSILRRPKQGFAMPLSHWIRTVFKSEVAHYLQKDFVERFGLLNPDYIDRIVKEHMQRKIDHRKKIWALLMFQYWAEKYY